jgi:predicted enzyme related to lactoylglutathione lyase
VSNLLVNIVVDDLEKGVRFYSEAFGLKVGRRFGEAGVEMIGFPAPIYLLLKGNGSVAAPGIRRRRDYRRHWTPVHIDVVVKDIDAAVERAKAAGAALEAPVKPANWGKLALMADPFGHGFCLIEFSRRGYDAIAESR